MELKRQLQNVIQHLITKENILLIAQDAKTKEERYLTISACVDLNSLPQLEGNNAPVY